MALTGAALPLGALPMDVSSPSNELKAEVSYF